jgi:hypothetical protein
MTTLGMTPARKEAKMRTNPPQIRPLGLHTGLLKDRLTPVLIQLVLASAWKIELWSESVAFRKTFLHFIGDNL